MWKIKPIPGKGLGVYAQRAIPRGTRIFSEKPLVALRQDQDGSEIYAASQQISAKDRAELLQLSSHITRESRGIRTTQAIWSITRQKLRRLFAGTTSQSQQREHGEKSSWGDQVSAHLNITSIFRSNAFNLGVDAPFHQAVFPRISRINHSCLPNSQGNFHPVLGSFVVHATRDIAVEEEVNINYLVEHGAVREVRLAKLLKDYGFECDCEACAFSARGVKGEERRLQMKDVWLKFASEHQEGKVDLEAELATTRAFVDLLVGEGLAGREVSTLYLEAARLEKLLGRDAEALISAERGLEIEQDVLGLDHPLYMDTLKKVEDLRLVV